MLGDYMVWMNQLETFAYILLGRVLFKDPAYIDYKKEL